MKQLLKSDKLIHNFINYIIVFTFAVIVMYWVGLLIAIAFSLLKEYIWDKWLNKGSFEIMDLIADGLGIIEATLMYFIWLWLN